MFHLNLDTMCEALFASHVQASDRPDSRQVTAAITGVLDQFGPQYCAGQVAQEFGDHPESAAARMRWVRETMASGLRSSVPLVWYAERA
ncbi:MAG: hypothetical protein HOV71_28560 [Hamadaea sp.]|uniref:hypothetical protein n=1 Tax=Hamadaea sp. NPDC050747 TaxID=3155789 RepID=UPI0018525933|nr:hypothetical protein [Hamadaea sp.]NUR52097.1 hypothetical protein [Hamadaea sp.]NUT05303.1 hypothetical protein [Hamadaea sp.]